MKSIKISLAVIVVAAITAGVYMWIAGITPPPLPIAAKNQFTQRIEQEIDSLGKLPNSKFCKDFYKDVGYHIEDYYKPNPPQYPYGRFGNSQSENDQWKKNLEKNLYSAYADKFIKQSFYVFSGSEWESDDLQFIRNEYQTLQKSELLKKSSPVDKKFTEIQSIFSKYDEIAGFISSCKGFGYSGTALSDCFPISDVQSKILRARTYLNNGLGNEYITHCTRLHDGLKEIPQNLFRSHVRYLDNKISHWSDMYPNFNSQSDYANNLYKPLKNEIYDLDNDTYNVSNFRSQYEHLTNKLNSDSQNAYNYFKSH